MPQSSSVNPANRGRCTSTSATGPGPPGGMSASDLIYNVTPYNQRKYQQRHPSGDYGGHRLSAAAASGRSGHNSLSLTRSTGRATSRTGSAGNGVGNQGIMSRSASQAASGMTPNSRLYQPTASSRSHQQAAADRLATARSLSRSHEERSPRTGRRVMPPHPPQVQVQVASVSSKKNGLNGRVHHQYQPSLDYKPLQVQVQVPVVVQQAPTPHSSPSKNALAASITASVGQKDLHLHKIRGWLD